MRNRNSNQSINTPIALTIAGSDSSGGAGIQADLKTFSALGVYGASVITAVTAQNTREVTAVENVACDVVQAQITAVLTDLNVSAIKIGMLSTTEIIEAVSRGLEAATVPIVLDPVMVAKSGDKLLQDSAILALKQRLIPEATLITPNLPEAATLLQCDQAWDENAMIIQGEALLTLGVDAVLMKGGHGIGNTCIDILLQRNQAAVKLSAKRLETQNTHGTGCTLSSAITANLAKGISLVESVRNAHAYVNAAIRFADQLHIGSGHGPVHHFYDVWSR